MRCHYVYDEVVGKVHIPGCWGAIYDPSGCICREINLTAKEFERDEYNRQIAAKNKEIQELEQVIIIQERRIKRILNIYAVKHPQPIR